MTRQEAEEILFKRNIFGKGEMSKMSDNTVIDAAEHFNSWLKERESHHV